MEWAEEVERIKAVAGAHGVDWAFIAAIRKAENGADNRAFGILSVAAPDYGSQLAACVKTIRGYLIAADDGHIMLFDLVETIGGFRRLVYSTAFVEYTARRYAPLDVANDPEGLNTNWASNVLSWYHKLATGVAGSPSPSVPA